MKMRACCVIAALLCAAFARAQDQPATAPTSWKDEIAHGYIPYKQLTIDDFPINDKTDPGNAFNIKPFVHPRPRFSVKQGDVMVEGAVEQWEVFSGFDRNLSWRKSTFKQMKDNLPVAQAVLDINEIYARRLGAMTPSELPQVRTTTMAEAELELAAKLSELVDANEKQIQAEIEAFSKATEGGHNTKLLREKADEIRKRLEATTPATVPYPQPPSAAAKPEK